MTILDKPVRRDGTPPLCRSCRDWKVGQGQHGPALNRECMACFGRHRRPAIRVVDWARGAGWPQARLADLTSRVPPGVAS